MNPTLPMLVAALGNTSLVLVGLVVASFALMVAWLCLRYGLLWFQAYISGADVSMLSLIGMGFRRVDPNMIVTAQIMVKQAGLNISRDGISTARLESHFLAGGDVMQVVRAIISARLAGMDLDFDRAAAINLAGRNVMEAVQISVFPRVINCPAAHTGRTHLCAVAKNGIELRILARVTVRTNLNQLVGGATEETIIARIGQGILSTIGAAATHMDVIETPERISKSVLARGLDTNTAFEVVSIDIAEIEVGENIGARLQSDQAEADMRIARALAETRRAAALALQQEMKAQVAANRANFVLAEAKVPVAMAIAIRAGQMHAQKSTASTRNRVRDPATAESGLDRATNPLPRTTESVARIRLGKEKEV